MSLLIILQITNKGYITFGTPYYGQTMTSSVFGELYGQAVAAPFWADLSYDSVSHIISLYVLSIIIEKKSFQQKSSITINWFSSINASQSDFNTYYTIIQRTVNNACPVQTCSLNFAAMRVVRVDWKNLQYQVPNSNQSIVSLIFEYFFLVLSIFFSGRVILCIYNKYI